ncbi:MAG: lytic murein transglycosylase [Beijerinckiaceae bacterium]
MKSLWSFKRLGGAAVVAGALAATVSSAAAQQCTSSAAGFPQWLEGFKSRARSAGVSQAAIDRGLDGVTYNPTVISLDRNQKSMRLSFEDFYRRRVSDAMIGRGRSWIQQNRGLATRLEQQFGVPAEILVSIWALETNFGAQKGNLPIIRSVATLAADCRRQAFFENELLAALKIVERGDLPITSMRGAWAGEIGQTQFMPSSYVNYAIDFDGNGRADLVSSVPDVLASTANFLRRKGWQRGAGWEEGTTNHGVLREWNKSGVYMKTIGVMANRMKGAGA